MRGTAEHAGNRNYLGQERINSATASPIQQALSDIANVRKITPALQRGLQLNVELKAHKAVFYRVLQDKENQQTALVLLNKSNKPASFNVSQFMQEGQWQEQLGGESQQIQEGGSLLSTVAANGVQVWVRDGAITGDELMATLADQMKRQ